MPIDEIAAIRTVSSRADVAHQQRINAADIARNRAQPASQDNGDEELFDGIFIGNYSKGLPHHPPRHARAGEVEPEAYGKFREVLTAGLKHSQDPSVPAADFNEIPLGSPANNRRLTNPQCGLAFDLEGPDGHGVNVALSGAPAAMPAAPSITSAECAGEMVELYWMALLRDVAFQRYDTEPLAAEAVADLQRFGADFKGTRPGQVLSPNTLFRGTSVGDDVGPYVSQFLLKGTSNDLFGLDETDGIIQYGNLPIDQRQFTAIPRQNYLINEIDFIRAQNGATINPSEHIDRSRRFIRNHRDLATYVHYDALYEAYLNACLILLPRFSEYGPPYPTSTDFGFGTLGGPHILSLVTEVATRALKAVWFQKWYVHRRLRPEAFGGLVHYTLAEHRYDGVLNSTLFETSVLDRIRVANQNTWFLPMAFPEGSPTHPAYGAGHATVAGACVTILKAFFRVDGKPIENPVIPNREGTALVPYTGADRDLMTVEGELNKLAANIAIGRNAAGVHWRSDYTESIRLGQAIAVGILEESVSDLNEDFEFRFRSFDGQEHVVINKSGVTVTP